MTWVILDYIALAVALFALWFLGVVIYGLFPGLFPQRKARVRPLNDPSRHLLAAYNYIKPIYDLDETDSRKAPAYIDNDLTFAATHIMHARQSDPRAQIVVSEKGGPRTYTVDDLAWMALFTEADLYHAMAKAGDPHALIHTDYRRSHGRSALEAIEKALSYRPHSAMTHVVKAQILRSLGERRRAREAVEQALAIDPTNRPALRMRDTV